MRHKNIIIIAITLAAASSLIFVKEYRKSSSMKGSGTPAEHNVLVQTEETVQVPAEKKLPALLEFGAIGCIPCMAMEKVLDELRGKYSGTLEVKFINVREDGAKASAYNIQMIPTQVFLSPEGKEIFRHESYFSADEITLKFKELGYPLSQEK